MGFRFRKSFRIAKGVKLNLSKSGFGISTGIKGMRVGFGPRGGYTSIGIPGTGISFFNYVNSSNTINKRNAVGVNSFQVLTTGKLIVFVMALIGVFFALMGLIFLLISQFVAILLFSISIFSFYWMAKNPETVFEVSMNKISELSDAGNISEALSKLYALEYKYADRPKFKYAKCYLLAQNDELEKAEALLTDLHKNDKLPTTTIFLANVKMNLNKYDDAISLLQPLLLIDNYKLDSILLLGACFLEKNNPAAAVEILKSGPVLKRNLDPSLVELHYLLGKAYLQLKDMIKSQKHFNKVVSFDSNYKEIRKYTN